MEHVSMSNSAKTNTRFENFSLELAMWRIDCLLGTIIPAHGHPKLSQPGTTYVVRDGESREAMADSRFLQLVALEDLSNDGFARVIGITQM